MWVDDHYRDHAVSFLLPFQQNTNNDVLISTFFGVIRIDTRIKSVQTSIFFRQYCILIILIFVYEIGK